MPISSAIRRESGVLRRFSATPLRPLTYFLTDVLVPFLMTLLGILLLFLVGTVVYRVQFEGNLFSLLVGISLGACAFFALGYAVVGLVPSARAVVVIGNVVLYPLMIFSGAMVPLEVMPDTVLTISRFLPLTHLVALLRGLWFGEGWGDYLTEVAVLSGVAIVGMLIIAPTFRWEYGHTTPLSSGLFRVKVHNEHGMAQRNGSGMFPCEVKNRFPLLRLEEESRLDDVPLRENAIERVLAQCRWTEMLDQERMPGGPVGFYTGCKLTFRAHNPKHHTEVGWFVAKAGSMFWDEVSATYGRLFVRGLALPVMEEK